LLPQPGSTQPWELSRDQAAGEGSPTAGHGPFYWEGIQTGNWFTAAIYSHSQNNSQERLGARKNEYHWQKIKLKKTFRR